MSDTPEKEKVKRLQPTGEVLRELFLKSGNLCAFPDCSRPIMSQAGLMVGQICHIEAADEGGERFNPNSSNEKRRAFSNLVLMCYEHHQETNDVKKFTVERMQEIKAAHEARVSDFIEKTLFNISDQTKLANPRKTVDCSRLNNLLGWNHDADELAGDAAMLNDELLANLAKVPKPGRQLLVVIIERATSFSGSYEMVHVHEVQIVCGLENKPMRELCTILEKYGLIEDGGEDDSGNARILVPDLQGWNVWKDFRALVKAGYATLPELVEDLNFSLLDEPIKTSDQQDAKK
jgi:hypothetical protein